VDYLHFLKARTSFVRRYYTDAAAPFVERRRKIEQSEEPYSYDGVGHEDGEPPFLEEWLEASEALDVLGQHCVSLLSSSLHLFVQEWVSELIDRAGVEQLSDLGIGLPTGTRYKAEFNKGWIAGYDAYCRRLGVDWVRAPSDLALLEQIVLARNTVQHPSDITTMRAAQSDKDLTRYPHAFFADAAELAMFNPSRVGRYSFPVRLDVTHEKLMRAVDEVEEFCCWLDAQHPMR
jgi:hypothetical protein